MFNPPGLRHQHTLGQLMMSLYGPVREQKRGLLLGPCGVILSPETLVVPDMLFISQERRQELLGEEYIEGPPDLVAEITTPLSSRMDQTFRRDLYAKHGVCYYWIVEPLEKRLRAFELGADGFYELVAEGHDAAHFSAAPVPNLVIPLADIWDGLSYA